MGFLKTVLVFVAYTIVAVSAQGSSYAGQAIDAATKKDCLRGYTGRLTTTQNVREVCENGFPNMDVYVTRLCEENECDNMRIRPFAKVSFRCGEDPESVMCI